MNDSGGGARARFAYSSLFFPSLRPFADDGCCEVDCLGSSPYEYMCRIDEPWPSQYPIACPPVLGSMPKCDGGLSPWTRMIGATGPPTRTYISTFARRAGF